MKSQITKWLLIILVLILTLNLGRTFMDLERQDKIIKDATDRLQKEIDENENLKRGLAKVESQEFIEREARNKLNLGKEGEVVILLPSISPITEPTPTPIDTSPNWQKWVRLFW